MVERLVQSGDQKDFPEEPASNVTKELARCKAFHQEVPCVPYTWCWDAKDWSGRLGGFFSAVLGLWIVSYRPFSGGGLWVICMRTISSLLRHRMVPSVPLL